MRNKKIYISNTQKDEAQLRNEHMISFKAKTKLGQQLIGKISHRAWFYPNCLFQKEGTSPPKTLKAER